MSEIVDLGQLQQSIQLISEKISHIEDSIAKSNQGQPTEDLTPPTPRDDTADVKLQRLLSAYEVMAGRLEALAPNRWKSSQIMATVHDQLDLPSSFNEFDSHLLSEQLPTTAMRQIFSYEDPMRSQQDRIRIGIASMPGREFGLEQVLRRLSPQADEIFVYLNGLDFVPENLPDDAKIKYFTGPDLGDRGKFKFMDGFQGYYLTCDDDISYAPFHVQSIIDGIERYDRKAVVGWHGSIFKEDFQEFYNPKYRQVLSFRHERSKDTPVHLLGTGVCGFHTSTINVQFEDFIYPNMADVFLAIAAKDQKIGMIVLKHKKDWATPLNVGPSISSVSLKKESSEKQGLDVATTVSELVRDQMPWDIVIAPQKYSRETFSVAFIGRTDKERWKKGGILKSAHLTVDLLNRFNVETILEDIETGDPKGLGGRHADIVMLYVGDPDRPDFEKIEGLVKLHASKGRHVLVNLSFNGKDSRSKFITQKITHWRKRYGNRVWLMVFTDSVLSTPDLCELKDKSVVIPKTISLPDTPCASFGTSDGVFIGDIAKLSDNSLLEYPASEWIAAIRSALPGVPLYAVQQYKPKYDLDLDIDYVWPFLEGDDFANKISNCRLMVSLVKFATFEMVPLEVSSLGVPVIYPEMPQSLSEHVGLSGFQVSSPEQLARILPTLYHDPIVWSSQSRAGIERAWSSELNRLSGQMYLRLIDLLGKETPHA